MPSSRTVFVLTVAVILLAAVPGSTSAQGPVGDILDQRFDQADGFFGWQTVGDGTLGWSSLDAGGDSNSGSLQLEVTGPGAASFWLDTYASPSPGYFAPGQYAVAARLSNQTNVLWGDWFIVEANDFAAGNACVAIEAHVEAPLTPMGTSNGWTEHRATLDIPSGSEMECIVIAIAVEPPSGQTARLLLDDVTISTVPTATQTPPTETPATETPPTPTTPPETATAPPAETVPSTETPCASPGAGSTETPATGTPTGEPSPPAAPPPCRTPGTPSSPPATAPGGGATGEPGGTQPPPAGGTSPAGDGGMPGPDDGAGAGEGGGHSSPTPAPPATGTGAESGTPAAWWPLGLILAALGPTLSAMTLARVRRHRTETPCVRAD